MGSRWGEFGGGDDGGRGYFFPSPKFFFFNYHKYRDVENSLVVQWLRLHAFTARAPGSIPGQGTNIPQAP